MLYLIIGAHHFREYVDALVQTTVTFAFIQVDGVQKGLWGSGGPILIAEYD